jgi:hypothetical protein
MERIAGVSIPLLQGRRDYSSSSAVLKSVREALLYQYSLTLAYKTGNGKEASYTVDPYTLVSYKGGLYLLGYAHNRKALRTFALERIAAVEMLRERFEIPEHFSLEEQFRSSFGIVDEAVMPVRIRFAPRIAHAVHDRIWHPTQRVEKNGDGSVEISFEAGGVMEIISWLLSYGENAELLQPAELRQEVAKSVRAMEEMYQMGRDDVGATGGRLFQFRGCIGFGPNSPPLFSSASHRLGICQQLRHKKAEIGHEEILFAGQFPAPACQRVRSPDPGGHPLQGRGDSRLLPIGEQPVGGEHAGKNLPEAFGHQVFMVGQHPVGIAYELSEGDQRIITPV